MEKIHASLILFSIVAVIVIVLVDLSKKFHADFRIRRGIHCDHVTSGDNNQHGYHQWRDDK